MTRSPGTGVRCMVMRGGTSKGAYFVADDLPTDPDTRDELLLAVMGSPDDRQIDGIGGAHPLTSKVAVVGPSAETGVDLDYLFLQVGVGEPTVSDGQNCGNLLAGVGPFAVERGLVPRPAGDRTAIRIRMVNTGALAVSTFGLRDGQPIYDGDTAISGVPGTAAPIRLDFEAIAGATCGDLLPTGSRADVIDGVEVTCVDNGMPCVIVRADDLGADGHATCATLEADTALRGRVERLRLAAGELMGLGDVTAATIPKMTLVSAPADGGALCTRSFIPHRCHDAIGVLAAVSVATAAALPGAVGHDLAERGDDPTTVTLEHPTGHFTARVELTASVDDVRIGAAGIIRTTRKLMDGVVFPRTLPQRGSARR